MPANITQKKNLDHKDKDQLFKLNVAYSECIASQFMPDFQAGKPVNINDYCVEFRS